MDKLQNLLLGFTHNLLNFYAAENLSFSKDLKTYIVSHRHILFGTYRVYLLFLWKLFIFKLKWGIPQTPGHSPPLLKIEAWHSFCLTQFEVISLLYWLETVRTGNILVGKDKEGTPLLITSSTGAMHIWVAERDASFLLAVELPRIAHLFPMGFSHLSIRFS